MTKIQCRCGAVEVEISVGPIVQFFCHCDDCQAVHGAYARIRLSRRRGGRPFAAAGDPSPL